LRAREGDSMTWRFSDGTTVELGGKVEGATLHAQRLREQLERGVRVSIWPPPGGDVDLDVNDPALVNAWLDQDLEWWRRVRGLSLRITERPDNIPALPPPPWADQPEDDAPADAVY
jgi:hypothetical protein